MENTQPPLSSGMPGGGRVWHQVELADDERRRLHGEGHCRMPQRIEAGGAVDVEFTFKIGETEIPKGGKLRVAWRWPFDWVAPEKISVQSVGAELAAIFQLKGDLNPWHHHIEIEVLEGTLRTGNRVELSCNGWPVPTFATQSAFFLMIINPGGGSDWIRLLDPQRYEIAPADPVRMVVIAEAEAGVGEMVQVRVRGEDRWGNPAPLVEVPVLEGGEVEAVADDNDWYACLFRVRWDTPGVHRLWATSGILQTESNPVRIRAERPERRLFWGDLHAGQTEIGCGADSLERHFSYARHAAGLQFASQQANDHYVTREIWQLVREVSHACDAPGDFVCYLGCEWSPFTEDGGDRNVIYRDDEERIRRSDRFFTEREPDPEPDLKRAPEFLAALRDEEVLLNLHVGGRPTNLHWHEPKIEPLFEIHSTHGTSEWFVKDAIERGYKVGITGGTDGVMGRPGACRPGRRVTRNVRNGLTAVCANELTREGLWEAFFARRCYATSGERILLWVAVDGHGMGEEYQTEGQPEIRVEVEGTAAIERVDILRGVEVIHCHSVAAADEKRLRVLCGGAEEQGTAGEQRVVWDGALTVAGGGVDDVQSVGLQSPLDQVEQVDGQRIAWRAATGGNDMGFSFAVAGGRCAFYTAHCQFEFAVDEVRSQALTVDAGGVSKRVNVGPAPKEDGPRRVEFSFGDEAPLSGEQAYWVRVVQVDQEQAWSSPVYVKRS